MLDNSKIEQITKQIVDAIPAGVKDAAGSFENKVKQTVKQQLSKLDFVTLEEFEIQQNMVLHLRQRINALEQRLNELEKEPHPEE